MTVGNDVGGWLADRSRRTTAVVLVATIGTVVISGAGLGAGVLARRG